MGLMDTIRSSVAASKRELERNTGNTGAYAVPATPSKEQILADAGVRVAQPAGISTIAGNNSTPFVPPAPQGGGQAIATPAPAGNIWTQTAQAAGQPLAPPVTTTAPPAVSASGNGPGIAAPSVSVGRGGKSRTSASVTPRTGSVTVSNFDPAARRIAGVVAANPENVDSLGRGYDDQVRHAAEVNARNGQAPTIAQAQLLGNTGMQTVLNAGNQGGRFNTQIAGLVETDKTAKAADTHKYTADQTLAGHKLTADAHIKGAEIAAGAAEKKAIAGVRQEQDKEQAKLQKDIYDNTLKSIDFTGITPTAAHEYATILAKTAGRGFGTIADPAGKLSDAIVHPSLLQAYKPALEQARTSAEYQKILNMMLKRGGPEAVHFTSIRGTAQLPRIQQAKTDPLQQGAATN